MDYNKGSGETDALTDNTSNVCPQCAVGTVETGEYSGEKGDCDC